MHPPVLKCTLYQSFGPMPSRGYEKDVPRKKPDSIGLFQISVCYNYFSQSGLVEAAE